jgi:hypothetical protein
MSTMPRWIIITFMRQVLAHHVPFVILDITTRAPYNNIYMVKFYEVSCRCLISGTSVRIFFKKNLQLLCMLITLGSLVLAYSFDYMWMLAETIHISVKQWGAYTYEGNASFFWLKTIERLLHFPFSVYVFPLVHTLTILSYHLSNQF